MGNIKIGKYEEINEIEAMKEMANTFKKYGILLDDDINNILRASIIYSELKKRRMIK